MTFNDLLKVFINSFNQSNLWSISYKSNSVSQILTPIYMLVGYDSISCENEFYYAIRDTFQMLVYIEIDSLEILIRNYFGEYHEL